MKTSVHDKKQYYILLALSVATTFLILLISLIMIGRNLISIGPFLFTQDLLGATGTAILIFVAARYPFRFCLPFLAIRIIFSLLASIVNLMTSSAYLQQNRSSFLTYAILNSLLSVIALPFIIVGITKISVKLLKNEFAAISITILAMIVIDGLMRIPNGIFSYYMTAQLHMRPIDSSVTDYIFQSIFSRALLSFLYTSLCVAAVYMVIRLSFLENKRVKFHRFFSKAKIIFKKLWEATAK